MSCVCGGVTEIFEFLTEINQAILWFRWIVYCVPMTELTHITCSDTCVCGRRTTHFLHDMMRRSVAIWKKLRHVGKNRRIDSQFGSCRGMSHFRDARSRHFKGKMMFGASATTLLGSTAILSAGSNDEDKGTKSTTLFAVGAVLGLGAIYAASKWGSEGGHAGELKKAENALSKGKFAKTERVVRNLLKRTDLDTNVRADAFSILANSS